MKHIIIHLIILLFSFQIVAKASSTKWTEIDTRFDSIALILENAVFNDLNRDNYRPSIDKLCKMTDNNKSLQLKARAFYWKAWSFEKNNNDSASFYIDKAVIIADSVKYPYDYIRFKYLQAVTIKAKGQWAEAYRILKQQETEFKNNNDIFWLAKTKVIIGAIFQALNENNEALLYFRQAEELFTQINCKNCITKNKINISNNLYMLGDKQNALNILLELERNPIVRKDTLYYINVLISIFQVSDQKNSQTPRLAHNLVHKLKYQPLYSLSELTLGALMANQNQNDSALYYLRTALISASKNKDVYHTRTILHKLSDVHQKLNNIDSAYHYLVLANKYQDSLLNHSKVLEMNKMEIHQITQHYETSLQKAEKDAIYQKNITIIIIIALLFVFGLICYILWLSRRKAIISKELKDTENKKLQLESERQQIEIDSKNRELSSNTLIIAQNNAKLKELYDKIETLEQRGKLADEVSEEFKNDLKSQLADTDDWQFFMFQFEQVYPNFMTRLKKAYPNLSETELRLCAYIRIGMSAKEIAQILSVQHETVNTTRYRIRKKIGLTTGESLEDHLRSL